MTADRPGNLSPRYRSDALERLRRTGPVQLHPSQEGRDFWAVTGHAELVEASRDTTRFACTPNNSVRDKFEVGSVGDDADQHMMHMMNGQLMAVFIDDNKDSINNQPGLIGFEIESQPCKISVRDIWLRKFD